jgi:flavodoxin
MKKMKLFFLAGLLSLTCILSGCAGTVQSDATVSAAPTAETTDVSRTLILYFSYSGHTRQLAQWIYEYTGADILRLDTVEPYSEVYQDTVTRGEAEHHENARPALAVDLKNLDKYDTILLGWPTWNYCCPMLIRTMLETYDFSNKKIIPFVTSNASGFSGSFDEMKESSPHAVIDEEHGLDVKSDDVAGAQETVIQWLASLGYQKSALKLDNVTGVYDHGVNAVTGATIIADQNESTDQEKKEENQMNLTINGKEYSATLAETDAAEELKGMLPISLTMDELNGNEKYGNLPSSLSQDIYQPGNIETGDILLWGDDTLVLFYKDFPTIYSYTAIAHLDDPSELAELVGNGSIQVTIH